MKKYDLFNQVLQYKTTFDTWLFGHLHKRNDSHLFNVEQMAAIWLLKIVKTSCTANAPDHSNINERVRETFLISSSFLGMILTTRGVRLVQYKTSTSHHIIKIK